MTARNQSGPLDAGGFLHQGLAAAVQRLPGGRELGLAATQLEHLQAEQFLELLDRVGDGGLRAVQALGGLCVAAGLDHGHQRAPLVECDPGRDHTSIR